MRNRTASSVLRLSFDSREQYQAYTEKNRKMLEQIWLWHEMLGNRDGPFSLPGICDLCQCQMEFAAHPAPGDAQFKFRVPWWVSATCGCSLTNLDRAILNIYFERAAAGDRVYHVGHFSNMRQWLSQHVEHLTSTQFEAGRDPGETENGVRFEDITKLSFDDRQFDCTICSEILEHIPDYRMALREMARTLKDGGRALMTFPWRGRDIYETSVRAFIRPDGTINHLQPPQYHGDPARAEGILSFRDFGWQILDEMRECGFARASAEFVFGPLHGYMTILNPVIVGTR